FCLAGVHPCLERCGGHREAHLGIVLLPGHRRRGRENRSEGEDGTDDRGSHGNETPSFLLPSGSHHSGLVKIDAGGGRALPPFTVLSGPRNTVPNRSCMRAHWRISAATSG